ncbi:MAG: TetR family transcriptional regulator C-terminal domain-containing protein [Gammaproteobacteria bacterium]|nr:TetR family transcriptional regulator C-terminal domain-containing protein [Gammaproteobacteria bacterium]
MPKLSQTATRKRRALPKAERRNQLIRATIKCIAKKGLAATTMADITNEADLSVGIVNLHFKTKEQLLIETLRFVADEYKEGFDQIFANEGMQGLEKLKAIIDYDFSPKIINRNKLAVWFAFLGEVKARPIYQRICAQHDDEINREICKLFSSLLSKNSKRKDDFELIASAYSALTDGLWLDILLSPRRSAVEAARNAAWQYVSGLLD